MTKQKEVLGIFIQKNDIANMGLETIHVTDFAIQTILKTIKLLPEVQEEVVDKLVDRTPNWGTLESDEQLDKIKTALTYETVIEYLRLENYIREDADMIEVAVDEEGSIVVSVYYVAKTDETAKLFKDEMSEEQINQLENQMNQVHAFDMDNILEEAKKRLEKKNNVIPFANRAARRAAKKQK
ncbi:hypothetical protein [Pradoshia sp.]